MKKTILILMFAAIGSLAFAQSKTEAEKLVNEGVAYHDKGDYDGAIARYDKALELDKDNLLALTEKAYSLLSLQKYDESVMNCRKAIELYPADRGLKTVYVTCGNAYDGLKNTNKALETYEEGIKKFPGFYLLYYNKGITLISVKKYDEAILFFQKAVKLNPQHASSHNAIARLSIAEDSRIPSLLAFCRFLALEQESKRANENIIMVQNLMKANVEQSGKKVTVTINPEMLADTTADGKPKENSFSATDLILSMDAALDFDKANKKKTDVEQFIRKFETVCSSLQETKTSNFGFFWDYYVPYFIEMKEKNLVQTFAYISFASSDNPEIAKWLKSHKSEIDLFFKWSESFSWKGN